MGQKPILLRDILTKNLSDLGLLTRARRYQVFSMWTHIVGKIAAHARPRNISDDILYVSTSSSTWSQELSLLKRKILSSINKVLGGTYIKDIRFSEHLWDMVSDEKTAVLWRRSQPKEKPRPPESEMSSSSTEDSEDGLKIAYLHGLSSEIEDEGLQNAFVKLASTFETRRKILLQRGYQVCRACGYIYPQSKRDCPQCRYKGDFLAAKRAESFLSKTPEMSDLGASVKTGIKDISIFSRVRDQLEDRWLMTIRRDLILVKRQPWLKDEIQELAKLFLSSRKNVKVQNINWVELEKEVGSRLARDIKDVLKSERNALERNSRQSDFRT